MLPFIKSLDSFDEGQKNATRLASLLGTWTGQTHLKTDYGGYELMAYFVVHFMPDPLRGNGCFLEQCEEEKNMVCVNKDNADNNQDNVSDDLMCESMVDKVVDWSDVVAFMYFGAKVDAGFPFDKHRKQDTGGWVGPISVILAQNETLAAEHRPDTNDLTTNKMLVDQYVTRYVQSPTTPFLRMPSECTLMRQEDFVRYMGETAVKETVRAQYDPSAQQNVDSYQKYLHTCENGDVKPLLPLFQFDFYQDSDNNKETVHVKTNYKLLTMPRKKDFMYNIYPLVQRKFNRADLGFHISGPYCYGDDPNRGYTFDMNLDTTEPASTLKLVHGCIEGLPCTPPAAELAFASGSSMNTKPNKIDDKTTTVKIGATLQLIVVACILLVFLLISLVLNFIQYQKFRKNKQLENESETDVFLSRNDDIDDKVTPFFGVELLPGTMEDSESDLSAPFLPTTTLSPSTTVPFDMEATDVS